MDGMDQQGEFFTRARQPDGTALRLHGDWVIDRAGQIIPALQTLSRENITAIDATAIDRMDSWGAMRLKEILNAAAVPFHLNDTQKRIFDLLPEETAAPRPPAPNPIYETFVALGRGTVEAGRTAYSVFAFIGEIAVCFVRNIRHPAAFRIHSIIRHIDETGVRALPIVGLLAVLISMVISYQAATQLAKFGANIFTVDLTVISLLREMGVLVTAILVAGRSGSAFAAELGVMKLREEIDALRTMGFDPVEMLVLPRLLAMLMTLPLLTFLADIIGLAGGAVISMLLLDIPLGQYVTRMHSVATPTMFFVGLVKAPVFAFVITVIGTFQGMNVTGSAESVGKLTTLAVVQSIFLVIMVDALFSIMFARLGI